MKFFSIIGWLSLILSVIFLLLGSYFEFLWLLLNSLAMFIISRMIKKRVAQDKKRIEDEEMKKKLEKEQEMKDYDEFVNSNAEKIGMTINEIKAMYPQGSMSQSRTIHVPSKGICPSCGGSLNHGTCQYCGNQYTDDSDITVLRYSCKYGTKTFTFNHGKLATIHTESKTFPFR